MNLNNKMYEGYKKGEKFCKFCIYLKDGYCNELQRSVYLDNYCAWYKDKNKK